MSPSLRLLAASMAASVFLILSPSVRGQQPAPACARIDVASPNPQTDILSAQQEEELGEFLSARMGEGLHVMDDPQLTARLRIVGDRLLRQLPDPGFQVQFYLSDLPITNAFTLVGGRIYITRKIVAFSRSEDELAGILAHELGHVVTHQPATRFTRSFFALGITQVGDRADVFAKFNDFLEGSAKIHSSSRPNEVEDEIVADRIGLLAMTRAGYDPSAFPETLDRLAGTKGNTGNWLTDLFGMTRPESKRLRQLLQTEIQVPAACRETLPQNTAQEFGVWRQEVISYLGTGHAESLPGLVAKKNLRPPLQEPFRELRFSPDGKYILAQDTTEIDVLTRDPLALDFQIDAPGALPASFTPDSQAVVFSTPGLRVERWDIADRQVTADELTVENGCSQSLLSPDGLVLACLTLSKDRSGWDLQLLDVASGNVIEEKPLFSDPARDSPYSLYLFALFPRPRVQMDFSTDARYFLAHAPGGPMCAFDLKSRTAVPVKGAIGDLTSSSFAFLGPDRIVGVAGDKGEKSAIASFPAGGILQKVLFGNAHPAPAGHGAYLLVRPTRNFAVGVFDLNAGQFIRASKNPALDVYDGTFVAQGPDGSIGLFNATSNVPIAKTTLPTSRLGTPTAVSVSDGLEWLAISLRNHGSIWNLQTGDLQLNLRGFRGADFGPPNALFAEFPRSGDTPASVGRIDLPSRTIQTAASLDNGFPQQWGRYLVRMHRVEGHGNVGQGEDVLAQDDDVDFDDPETAYFMRFLSVWMSAGENWQLDVSDSRTGSLLWSRHFPKQEPAMNDDPLANVVPLIWRGDQPGAKEDAALNPESQRRFDGMTPKDQFVEYLDAQTGKTIASLRVDTHNRAFGIVAANLAGDSAILEDDLNRLLVYSIADESRKAVLFGTLRAMSPDGKFLCYEDSVGREVVYDLRSFSPVGEEDFPEPVSFARFSNDSSDLLVVTSNQVAYVSRIPSAAPAPPTPPH